MLFQRSQIDRMGPSKHLLVQIQQQEKYEICPKSIINTIESRSDVFTVKRFYC